MSGTLASPARVALAINLDLSRGRHGAAARIEVHDRKHGRVALVRVSGWLDRVAMQRLGEALDDLAARGVGQVLFDCSPLRHIDYRLAPLLLAALMRFERRAGGFVLCGLSPYLRDVFRLAGCGADLRCWPSAAELLATPAPLAEPGRERTS